MSWTHPCFGGDDHLVGKAYCKLKGSETAGKVETWEVRALDG